MIHNYRRQSLQSGFSLLEVSIVLSILAVVLAGVLPFLTQSTKSRSADDTIKRMDAIEQALASYYAEYDKIPCPSAIGAAQDSTDFGKGAVAPACTGTGIASSGPVRGGGVPVKDLGLSDDYAFDGWGRKFSYNINNLASNTLTFTHSGTLIIKDANGNALSTTGSYVLISFGPNGHGGYTTAENKRYNAGSTSTGEAENCDDGIAPCAGAYNNVFVRANTHYDKPGDDNSQFDDVVRYRPAGLIENAQGSASQWKSYGQHISSTNMGNVGIGTNSPQHKLHVSGGVQANYFNNSSDAQLKTDVKTSGGLDIISRLRGVSFNWKEGNKPGMGVIAQEVEPVLPGAVTTNSDDGMKAVEYNQLIAPLIESVKQLQAENKELKDRLDALQAKVDAAKTKPVVQPVH